MTWPIIIKRGPDLNQTLSGIKFGKFGNNIQQNIFICDEWVNGFNWAKEHGHGQALFVNSGTLITDWQKFAELIDNYPHSGLIAHLIYYPDQRLYLHDQCWFMNIDYFESTDFTVTHVDHPLPIRAEQNLHDDYTPLWVRPSSTDRTKYDVTKFGQGIIARQMQNNRPIVNWNNPSRDLKFFMYNKPLDLTKFQYYKDIAENQLWVFNNEPIVVVKKEKLITPGSGLSWMLNLIDPSTKEIQIVDVSCIQIKFCQALWANWNGNDYGTFVWNFIEQNKLVHYEIDNPNLTEIDRLKLKGRTKFIEYVNATFKNKVNRDFMDHWMLAKQTKTVGFCNDNLIKWVINNDVSKYDHIWCSNILEYKWTLLHTTVDEYQQFQSKIK